MQIGDGGGLTRINGRRKRETKGLEAIFTSQKDRRDVEVLAGAASIVAGALLLILAAYPVDATLVFGPWGSTVYSPLTFGSLGVLLLMCGGGTIMFAVAQHEARLSNTSSSAIDEHSEADLLGDAKGPRGTPSILGPGSRIGAVAFAQSLVLVALYSGFVQEFESNLTMQAWVWSNFPVGQSILNWEGVLILSVSLGLLLLQFLPGRFFSE